MAPRRSPRSCSSWTWIGEGERRGNGSSFKGQARVRGACPNNGAAAEGCVRGPIAVSVASVPALLVETLHEATVVVESGLC